MDTEGQELGPYKPASDTLILAAIERAACHGTDEVWVASVGKHLGFQHAAQNTRRLRRQLEELRIRSGWIASRERHGREYWRLTPAGRRELASARAAAEVGELPESPQHRNWRLARAAAAERIVHFRTLLSDALEDAGDAETSFIAPPSTTFLALAERVAAALWLVGSAIYCLDEWPEPDDARLDTDPDPGPLPGRRALTAWKEKEALAKGGQQ